MIVYVLFVHKKFKIKKNQKKNIFSGFFQVFFWGVFWVGFLLPTLLQGALPARPLLSHQREVQESPEG